MLPGRPFTITLIGSIVHLLASAEASKGSIAGQVCDVLDGDSCCYGGEALKETRYDPSYHKNRWHSNYPFHPTGMIIRGSWFLWA
jgi:hypothetical protein